MNQPEYVYIEGAWTEGGNNTIKGTAEDLDGTIVDITGATIELIYWFGSQKRNLAKLSGSLVVAASGTYKAKFDGVGSNANGIPSHGEMHFIWRLTESGGDEFHSIKEWIVKVRPKLKQVA